jgi:ubiquinone/menaquinone biosynthesis C-methylase UbiE
MNQEQARQLVSAVSKTYDSIADHFDLTRTNLWNEFQHFTPFLKESQKVLDIGCGNGRNLKLFENMAVEYLGVDISQSLISIAQNKDFSGKTLPKFQVADLLDLSRVNGNYDVVMLIAVIQHIPKVLQDQALTQIVSKMKPGSVLLMTNWNMWQKKFLKIRFEQFFKRLFRPTGEIYNVPNHDLNFYDVFVNYKKGNEGVPISRYLYAYNVSEISKLLKRHGFTIIENFYSSGAKRVPFYRAKNILTIARYNQK